MARCIPPRESLAALALATVAVFASACSRFGPIYPSRPAPSEGPPAADPEPARIVAHLLRAVSRRPRRASAPGLRGDSL